MNLNDPNDQTIFNVFLLMAILILIIFAFMGCSIKLVSPPMVNMEVYRQGIIESYKDGMVDGYNINEQSQSQQLSNPYSTEDKIQ